MADKNDAPVVDKDKETLMEVRGIIDGVLDSGSKEYKASCEEILSKVNDYSEYSLN